MADFYPYLVASLPMLHFQMKPPFSFERFCEICCPLIPAKDYLILRTLPLPSHYQEKGKRHPVIRRWVEFDGALRNELVKIRAAKKHRDPAAYLRPGYSGIPLPPAVMAATVPAQVLDGEKALDEVRWKELEDLATGHYFDLEFLILYAYRLLILLRWDNIRSADRTAMLEQVL